MKKHQLTLPAAILSIAVTLIFVACKKDAAKPAPRTIRYILYTKENFSTNQDTIRFRLLMQTSRNSGGILFDSSLAAMTISAIPDSLHRLVFTKTVPTGHEKDTLLVGFIYDIDNVGESWFLDSSAAGPGTKTVEYSFR
jgi:hypothetical protein